ncbi:MAG TPA: MBL fold metallo-hydrolase [Salinimicrobium sp.]|nr:MBL fold metallo-hydrolase [Salinimicrobium sp.]
MKSIDVMEVEMVQSIETIKDAQRERAIKILPDTFLFKIKTTDDSTCQGYAIRHLNGRDILLIDAISEKTIKDFRESGYHIKGILLTSGKVVKGIGESLQKMKEEAGDAPIFIHPLDTSISSSATKDITGKHEIFSHFSLSVHHFPGVTGGSVVIHSEINNGMLFCGDSAVGSSYETDEHVFSRPENKDSAQDFGLAETWNSFDKEFAHILPRCGKPQFDLEEAEQNDLLQKLGRSGPISK